MAEQHPCPNCGEAVAIVGGPQSAKHARAHEGDETAPVATEQATCPTCGEVLVRDSMRGEGWRLAEA